MNIREGGSCLLEAEASHSKRRVETYEGGRAKDLYHVNHMHQIKQIMERKMFK